MSRRSVVEILEDLDLTRGKLAKRALLGKYADDDLLKEVFQLTQDPYVNFYVAKVPKVKPGQMAATNYVIAGLMSILKNAMNRVLRGNAIRDALAKQFEGIDAIGQKWMGRIITRNLRNGIGEGSIEEAWPGLVPKFEVALADTVEWKLENEKLAIITPIHYPCRVEPKWDGYRCVVIKENGVITMLARSGRVFERGPKIAEWFEQNMVADNFVIDGEIIGGDNWNDTASILGSKVNHKADDALRYHAFDCMPLENWRKQDGWQSWEKRRHVLESMTVLKWGHGPVELADGQIASSEEELIAFYEECLEKGYEGIVIKDFKSNYIFDRSPAFMKLKPYTDYDCVIVGIAPGNAGTKWADKLVKLQIKVPGSDATTTVGTGTDDDEKENINLLREKLIGRPVEVRGAPKLAVKGKILFPRFQRYREEWDCAPKVRDLIREVKGE